MIVLSAGLLDPEYTRQILSCASLGRVFRVLPIDQAARLDVVDIGFVAETVVRLMARLGLDHDCYHLSAGSAGAATVAEMTGLVDRTYGRRRPLRLIPPAEWDRAAEREFVRTPLQRRVFRSLRYLAAVPEHGRGV